MRIHKIMSITRVVNKRKQKDRELSEKALKEFLAKGGKVKEIPEGEITEAANMKFKYRRTGKKKPPEE
jgi:hypothetical protein